MNQLRNSCVQSKLRRRRKKHSYVPSRLYTRRRQQRSYVPSLLRKQRSWQNLNVNANPVSTKLTTESTIVAPAAMDLPACAATPHNLDDDLDEQSRSSFTAVSSPITSTTYTYNGSLPTSSSPINISSPVAPTIYSVSLPISPQSIINCTWPLILEPRSPSFHPTHLALVVPAAHHGWISYNWWWYSWRGPHQ